MTYALFFLYLLLFCWLLTKIKFFKNSGLSQRVIIILFLIKVLVGIFSAWINVYIFPTSDSLYFHEDGIKEFHILFSNPKEYLVNIFHSDHSNGFSSGFFDTTDSFWNNLRSNIISKVLSIFDIFSNCNYYINTLFFDFLIFAGIVAFYKIFIQLFPSRKTLVMIPVFLLPSVLFFSSMIHRDGLILLSLSIVCYNLFFILKKEGFTFRRAIFILFGLTFIFLLRNFVFITLLPGLIAWIIAEKKKRFAFQSFIAVYVLFVILFFTLPFIDPGFNLPEHVSSRQIAFIQLSKSSASAININPLFPNFRSFLNNAPQALNHSLMRPYVTENHKWLYIPSSVEILTYEILFLLFIFFRIPNQKIDPFIYFSLFFFLTINLQIGYTIPIIGALVRYRSIYFIFAITPLLCFIDWKKIKFPKQY